MKMFLNVFSFLLVAQVSHRGTPSICKVLMGGFSIATKIETSEV